MANECSVLAPPEGYEKAHVRLLTVGTRPAMPIHLPNEKPVNRCKSENGSSGQQDDREREKHIVSGLMHLAQRAPPKTAGTLATLAAPGYVA